jgi:hypothetical protein
MNSLARSAAALVAVLVVAPSALAAPYDLIYTDRFDVTLCESGCGITLSGCDFAVLVNTGTAPITETEMRTARFTAVSSESTITLFPFLNIYTSFVPALEPGHARGAVCSINAFLETLLLPGEVFENIQGNQFLSFNISRTNGGTFEGPVTFDCTMDMGSFRATFRIEATVHLGPHALVFQHGARVQSVPGPPPTITAQLDIKPGDCPNLFNPKSGGVVPFALAGSPTLNVRDIQLASVRLAGFAPVRTAFADLLRAFSTTPCECIAGGADGYEDLALKFSSDDVSSALGSTAPGGTAILSLTGLLANGTPFEARDCLSIVAPPPPDSLPGDSTIAAMVVRRDPSSSGAKVAYTLAEDAIVDLSVYDVTGRYLESLVRAHQQRGPHEIQWRAEGHRPGVYFLRLDTAGRMQMRRFVLLR